jgi:hypothetical protein
MRKEYMRTFYDEKTLKALKKEPEEIKEEIRFINGLKHYLDAYRNVDLDIRFIADILLNTASNIHANYFAIDDKSKLYDEIQNILDVFKKNIGYGLQFSANRYGNYEESQKNHLLSELNEKIDHKILTNTSQNDKIIKVSSVNTKLKGNRRKRINKVNTSSHIS